MKQRDDWHLTERVMHENGRGDPFAAAIRGTRMPMVITDPRKDDNPIVFVNEAFQKLSGYGVDEILGRNCRFLQGPDTSSETVAIIRNALAAEEAVSIDILNYRKDGSAFWNALYISPVRGDDGIVQFFFASQLDVTDRIEAQRQIADQKIEVEKQVRARTLDLQEALEEKTLLLHEVDHRVKNNLTMIGALLRLQSRTLGDPKLQQALENMLERIDALAVVHRRLYQSDDITQFDIGAFAANLASDVLASMGRKDIALVQDVDPAFIPASKASATGLILNEIITNAVKHAFVDGRSGTLGLSVKQRDGAVFIELQDDGAGFDPSETHASSIGQSLVTRLSRQIKATTEWHSDSDGTRVSVTFPAAAG
ncbi:MAG: histidine kinase dimerization/phosphoacceptor domain -containing protein [Sphingobium sp.]|uniref:histidine kinase dimerization/phosphoacceptor domain -containing protein n=1 Tax=Sphingobium sp. TaxID=1912891 RepID=UPI0029ACBA5B|nr:histidine kinase dimerization/phosphoacceptor domain -containing protein [Sphingobium sp.]MDX3909418.1 histidine kinase dimerization/phosphoacceptor domain -containing protein [Sphingobium sp.]